MLNFRSTVLLLALPAAQGWSQAVPSLTDAQVYFAASPVFPLKRALELSVESLDSRALRCQLVVKAFMIQTSETAPSMNKLLSVNMAILPSPFDTPSIILGTSELDATGIPGLKFHSGDVLGTNCTEARPRIEVSGLKTSYAAGETLNLTWKALDIPTAGLSYSHQSDCDGLTWSEDASGLHATGLVPPQLNECTLDVVASLGDYRLTKRSTLGGAPSLLRAEDLENRYDPNTGLLHTGKEHTHIFFEKTSLQQATLPDLEGLNGNLYLNENPDLTSLDLPAWKNLNGIFYMMKNPQLQTVKVPELRTITSNLYVEANTEMKSLRFPKLEKVDHLYISKNKKLQTLVFDALTNVKHLSLGYGIEDFNHPNIKFCFRKKLTADNILIATGRNLTPQDILTLEQSFVVGSTGPRVYTADKQWVSITPKGNGSCPHITN